ncbi:MAG TPA: YihY/virulence factor BrkB family protein [Pyrinomonadaceae bacterium]|jgi:membrane protein|nr:YihY/virulence factor BrkB family protein [Pyrinomonadaceae bacterium]
MFKSLSLGGLGWGELAKRVYAETTDDDVLGRAAQLSYYFLLALFPALLFLTSLLGYFAGEDSQLRASLFNYLSTVLPGEASKLVTDTVNDVTQASGGGKLSFGILATFWAASNGMGAISESLNAAYDLKETRSWWKVRLIAVGLTLALSFLIVSSLVLVLYGHDLADTIAVKFGLGAAFAVAWKVLQWPIVLGFVLLAFALIYYFAPDSRDQDWKWITPGAIVGVALWLLISFGFKAYLSFFNSYSATYGSLGAVIILMLWFYFTGVAILVGGEMNSEIENEMAKQGAPDAKEKGEKAPDAGKDSGANAKGSSGRGDAHAAPTASSTPARERVTRMDDHEEGFSLGKAAVVGIAWALSKVGLGRTEKRTR